jgi:hypothetical protein
MPTTGRGEFEQALRTCKAIAETAFLKEMQIAGTLDRLGERKSSVQSSSHS